MPLDLSSVSITQLTYASAVARHRHFGKAAETCEVTQPTLSMQIKKLETSLGVVLFDRSRKPVEMTQVGEQIIRQMGQILQEISRIEDIVDSARGEIRGDFHLGIIPTLAPYLLPRFLEDFGRTHPDVTLYVQELQTDEMLIQINDGHIDAGLLATPTHAQGIIEQPLFFEPFYVLTTPGHPLLKKKTVRQEDLSLDEVWLLTEGHCLRNQTLHLCELKRSDSAKRVHFAAGSLETLIRMVEQGSGYTLMPQLATEGISNDRQRNTLRKFSGSQPGREISIAFSRADLKRGIIDALSDSIRANLPSTLVKKGRRNVIDIQDPATR